ncbi:MAG: outer membrane lipoprotein-sorting protein [Bryobacteraceae bacterium]|nr:outer membrane lipoprotein-sorting protein [Bryobacteraceae bacterium]MDW8379651.1 hypothetical protein [Bryobacterales bacterium]
MSRFCVSLCLRVVSLSFAFSVLAHSQAAKLSHRETLPESEAVLDQYVQALARQQQEMKGVSMEVDIHAELPKLKKKGHMSALRFISRLGRITYDAIKFEGDQTIKREVIARYLAAETESDAKTAPPITPAFYKFRYKGLTSRDGRSVYVFEVSPKKKQVGTFKGELWLDKETCLPVREAGRFSKNPSVFVRRFEFVRQYEIQNGLAIPRKTLGMVDTRLWGKAEVEVAYSNFQRLPEGSSYGFGFEAKPN